MDIYLPIAEVSANVLALLAIGATVGLVAGLFGVGGGFLSTPLLILLGIPPTVAIATASAQIAASSASGAVSHALRGSVAWSLAATLVTAGMAGSAVGVVTLRVLDRNGHAELIIALCYLVLLGAIGATMCVESIRTALRGHVRRTAHATATSTPTPASAAAAPAGDHRLDRAPGSLGRMEKLARFAAFAAASAGVGFLGALLGIGGGILIVPILIYVMRVPTGAAIGTSSVMLVASMSVSTTLHAATGRTVDAVLAIILIVGGVLGTQFGLLVGSSLRPERLRLLLGLLILAISSHFGVDLMTVPADADLVRVVAEQPR